MPAHVKFISTRPNTNTEFWWTTADPTVTQTRNQVLAATEQAAIPFEMTTSPDGLTLISKYTVESEGQWTSFTASLSAAMPGLAPSRVAYFQANGHTLKLEAVDAENGNVLKEINIV